MRDTEKIKNKADNSRTIDAPIKAAVFVVIALVTVLIWFGIKDPLLYGKIRDLVIFLTSVLLFLLGSALAVLFFFLSSKIEEAKGKLDQLLSRADIKIEELAEKVAEILRAILQPVIEAQSRKAGILHIFAKSKNKD